MEPATVGVRLASSVATPLIKKLFRPEGPGAGLVDKPVRISSRVSFRGEQHTLGERDFVRLTTELVNQALKETDERLFPADEMPLVVHSLADTLYALGDITMTDVQAVELGHTGLARRLRQAAGHPNQDLSFDAELFYERLLDTACLHILHFFTQRSTFVARTLVEQTRRQSELIAKVDELIARTPRPGDGDGAFERRYLAYAATKHSQLTIYGIDLANTPDRWPLDAAYLTLQALRPATSDEDGRYIASPGTPLPADEALAEQDLVLLRGVAGSGKTTLVQWLAVTAARGERGDRIPFVLPLRTLVRRPDGLPAPAGFLAAVRVPFHDTAPDAWPDRVLTAGRGLLLVDGIDEIPESDRERTRRWLRDLIDTYPGNQWLVTSRPSAVREDWLTADGFTELALSPMSREDVTAFVERWHRAARIGAPDTERLTAYETSLLDAVRTKPDLGRLATNPLMCGLICALHRDRRGYLPHGRQELYDAALSMLLSRRDQERDMLPHDDIRLTELPQIQLLQRLAYWLIRNNQAEMDRERAERLIADALPSLPAAASPGDATAIHRHLLVRSGLLREPTLGTVEFVHRTFQDYLGAKAAVEDGDFGLLVRNAADSQWSDVIRMAVAHARPRERAGFLRDLLAAASDERTDPAASTRIRLLALAGLEHATELDPQVRADVEEQAATLIPPRTVEEAADLASVGPARPGTAAGSRGPFRRGGPGRRRHRVPRRHGRGPPGPGPLPPPPLAAGARPTHLVLAPVRLRPVRHRGHRPSPRGRSVLHSTLGSTSAYVALTRRSAAAASRRRHRRVGTAGRSRTGHHAQARHAGQQRAERSGLPFVAPRARVSGHQRQSACREPHALGRTSIEMAVAEPYAGPRKAGCAGTALGLRDPARVRHRRRAPG